MSKGALLIKACGRKVDNILLDGKLWRFHRWLNRRKPNIYNPNYYETYQDYPFRSFEALEILLKDFRFDNVLDIGCGNGVHSDAFLKAGKTVTALDYGESIYFRNHVETKGIDFVVADINKWHTDRKFDCIWCSHVLEHQLNVNNFLKKVNDLLKEGGVLAISVPPLKAEIVGGHVTLWNPGILLYNLILAGFDCSEARVGVYDYDISVIVTKKTAELPDLAYDIGDIRRLKKYFPKEISYYPRMSGEEEIEQCFNGNIEKINWK
ncbi:class I SAM-dependent methyltransferase [Butyrivibrio proteoclasticus]|uniref:class I SAM-dependent methyltransferase n=1 Tax=Butyrivibrio proteoclasticus TaxID=43305 RepID=UPI00047DF31A|nr:class I SAM-dependent methyltransferase [Butyrivibrio proteoclasticus]